MSEKIYHRITITGDPGSGKTTFARNVAARTGYELITTGNMFRELARAQGISVAELNERAETQEEIDRKVDDYLVGLNDAARDLVLDSRMAWHFLRKALKIRLTVDPAVAAERIFSDAARGAEEKFDRAEAIKQVERRRHSEINRYKALYDVDIGDDGNFDLVIDTSYKSQDDVLAAFDEAFSHYKARLDDAA